MNTDLDIKPKNYEIYSNSSGTAKLGIANLGVVKSIGQGSRLYEQDICPTVTNPFSLLCGLLYK
jgi:hypothetical protein